MREPRAAGLQDDAAEVGVQRGLHATQDVALRDAHESKVVASKQQGVSVVAVGTGAEAFS